MTRHAESSLGGFGVSEILNSLFAISTAEAVGTERFGYSQNGYVPNLFAADLMSQYYISMGLSYVGN